VKRSRSQFRWTLPLTSALLSIGMTVGNAAIAADKPAGSDAGYLPSFDGSSLGEGEDLYLDVTINQQPTGQLAHFGARDGQLWASRSTLRQLGIQAPPAGPDPLPLSSLDGLVVDYDAAHQSVSLTAPLALLDRQPTMLNSHDTDTVPHASSSPGVLLNYDLYGTHGNHGSSSLSAYTELRAFARAGVFSSTALSQATRLPDEGWRDHSARLDSSWETSFPERMLSLRAGDTLTSATAWSRSTRIAGLQLSRNFALQPYRITTPLPAFLGEATTPSAVDLYINGIRQYSGKVAPGPFQVSSAPTISGSGIAQVVLTDAIGRISTIDFPFYGAEQLLQKGLSDWSAELGVVRENYGITSFDYGHDPAASGTLRYGVSDRLTAHGHLEATDGLAMAGLGGNLLLGDRGGVINLATAHSQARGNSGNLYNIGYQWNDGRFNVALDSTRTRGHFLDVASLYGTPPPSITEHALVGYNGPLLGSINLSYLRLRYAILPVHTDDSAPRVSQDTRYASASWFRAFDRRMTVSLSLNQNLDERRDRSIFLGFTLILDDRTQMGVSLQRNGHRDSLVLDANRSVPSDTGFGWRTQLRGGEQRGGLAEGSYRSNFGEFDAGINSWGNSRNAYADARGALVLMGGHAFAARSINDGFAVVSTNGVADVPVLLENRPIGLTDAHGMLLVNQLNAWQKNRLAIDPMSLPADTRIDRVDTIATPSNRAGTLVKFDITPIRAATVTLVDAAGKPLPLGSHVRIAGQTNRDAVIGFDGEVYLDTLDARNTLEVDTPAGHCQASFEDDGKSTGIPRIGPLTCQPEATP